jgi:hypothetical protein
MLKDLTGDDQAGEALCWKGARKGRQCRIRHLNQAALLPMARDSQSSLVQELQGDELKLAMTRTTLTNLSLVFVFVFIGIVIIRSIGFFANPCKVRNGHSISQLDPIA